MSPILVRPVREQLEHDRIIRLLQVRLKRRHEVAVNIDPEHTVPVKIGTVQLFPDLVLTADDRGKKLEATVEVETAESVNHLEAMSQWAHLGRARAPFHLYVPASCVEIARRLATENHVHVSELWSYHTIGDQTRFTLVHRAPAAPEPRRSAEPRGSSGRAAVAGRNSGAADPAARKRTSAPEAKPKTNAKSAPAAKTAAKAKKKTPAKPSAKAAQKRK